MADQVFEEAHRTLCEVPSGLGQHSGPISATAHITLQFSLPGQGAGGGGVAPSWHPGDRAHLHLGQEAGPDHDLN